jgi:hypothetical protein
MAFKNPEDGNRYTEQYRKEHYDRFSVQGAKGIADKLSQSAKERGVSRSDYILAAVKEYEGIKAQLDEFKTLLMAWITDLCEPDDIEDLQKDYDHARSMIFVVNMITLDGRYYLPFNAEDEYTEALEEAKELGMEFLTNRKPVCNFTAYAGDNKEFSKKENEIIEKAKKALRIE